MKKTKLTRLLALAVAVLIIMTVSLALVGCKAEVDDEGTATIVVENDEETLVFKVSLDKVKKSDGVLGALEYLKEKGKLDFTYVDSSFGAYLTKVGHVEEKAEEGIYIGIWTSVAKDADTSMYATTKEYKGKTLTSSGVGISSMSIKDGCIIDIGEIIYN